VLVDTFTFEEHEEYEDAGFSFAPVAQRRLISHLKAAGYKVILVPAEREKPSKLRLQLLRSYDALLAAGVDAYLDVTSSGVGFMGNNTFSKKVGPHVSTFVRLVSARTKEVLYQDIIQYGWGRIATVPGPVLDAPEDHVFKSTKALRDDLFSDMRRGIAQLEHGIDVVMQEMVSGFSPYPISGLSSPPPTTVAKAAPTIGKGATTPSKVAIFPFASNTDCIGQSRPLHKKLASEVETLIRGNDSLTLAYSYYDKDRTDPPIKKLKRLWPRRSAKPNADEVFSLGEARGVDVVVMYWRDRAGLSYCQERMPPFRIDVYVFDIKQRKTYRQKGREKNLSTMTEQVLSRFLAGRRPQVVATAPTEPGQAKNISQDAASSGPLERITLRPGGSVQAIEAAAAAYCGTLNKRSRLIAAPPDNPEYVFGCYPPTGAVSTPTPPPTTVAKAAPAVRKGTTTPFKVAIFPFGSDSYSGMYSWCIGTIRPSHEKLASDIETLIKGNDSLTLAYSYYDKDRNYPPIKRAERLWPRRSTKPNAAEVFSLGEARGVDVVVMYWRDAKSGQACVNQMPPFPMDVHVFDVKQRKTYRQRGVTTVPRPGRAPKTAQATTASPAPATMPSRRHSRSNDPPCPSTSPPNKTTSTKSPNSRFASPNITMSRCIADSPTIEENIDVEGTRAGLAASTFPKCRARGRSATGGSPAFHQRPDRHNA
jgi:hypothetical protein